jgi:hypothetical protein
MRYRFQSYDKYSTHDIVITVSADDLASAWITAAVALKATGNRIYSMRLIEESERTEGTNNE